MALVGDDPERKKLLEENLDRLLRDLDQGEAGLAPMPLPPEDAEASYQVRVAPDRLSATVDLLPPRKGGRPLDWLTLVDDLNDQGFVALLAEPLAEAVDRCNEGTPQRGVLAARGIPPRPPKEARVEILFGLEGPCPEGSCDPEAPVDYRERGHVLCVEEGTLLAVFEPAEEGVPGTDVYGVPIPVEPPREVHLVSGRGVALLEDGRTYAATLTGQPVLDGSVLRVDPIYEIPQDVDYATGNVRFEGTVVVRGNVRNGFSVVAGVDLEVFGHVENARLQAQRDVVIHGGLVGGQARAEAGQDVWVRHVEHGVVLADRDIRVAQYALHGTLFSGGAISFQGRRGVIGGRLEAFERIDVFTAGTPLGTRTHLVAGSHFRVRLQLQETKERLAELEPRIVQAGAVIQAARARFTENGRLCLPPELAERVERLLAHYDHLVEESRALQERSAVLRGILRPQNSNKGIVKVRGMVFPGATVEIRGRKKEILDKQRFVTFYLDQDRDEITFGPYQ